jgi:hypothetical protein
MKPSITVTKVFENLSGLRKAMSALTDQDVYIGIPEDKTARKEAGDSGISNAYLGYIHEFGVPEKNIPARPHLLPGIGDIRPEAVDLLKGAAKQALEGNAAAVEGALNKIGLLGQNAVRARFVNNDWPPLTEKTLKKKGERPNPLIDTGQLRKAYTYVVRKKGGTALVVK